MTGYTVHTGSTRKFAEGWDSIFGGKKSGKKTRPATGNSSNKKVTGSKAASGTRAKSTSRKKSRQ